MNSNRDSSLPAPAVISRTAPRLTIVTAFFCLTTFSAAADDPMRSPWTSPPPALAVVDEGFAFPGGVLDWALAAYQGTSSPVSGGRCPMTPSCSAYAREAIGRYGAAVGVMMTVDRLYHEQGLIGEVPFVIRPDGTGRWFDPPEGNLLGQSR
jgi:hypothetical protein